MLGSSLLSLGLDQQPALIVSLLGSTAIAGAAAALITDSILFSWLTGFVMFAVVFAASPAIDAAPPTLPGERVAASLYVLAFIAFLCCGIAAAGIGAAGGFGARRASVSTWRLVRSGSPSRLAAAASTFLLLGASIFGVLRLPGILMYGPWSGVVEAARPVAQGQQLTFDYWSRAFGTTRSAVVVLPPEYASSPDLAFPVYPNGVGPRGGAEDWADDMDTDQAIPAGRQTALIANDPIATAPHPTPAVASMAGKEGNASNGQYHLRIHRVLVHSVASPLIARHAFAGRVRTTVACQSHRRGGDGLT